MTTILTPETMTEIEEAQVQTDLATAQQQVSDMIDTAAAEAKAENPADPEAELRAFKRKLRVESLRAKEDMGWCVSGTNERLAKLGLRLIGDGVTVRVRVSLTREMYVKVDADSPEEAAEVLATDPDVVIADSLPLGWKLTPGERPESVPEPDEHKLGDPDPTWANPLLRKPNDYISYCGKHSSRHGSCTMPVGHGGRQHVVGNGMTVVGVWTRRD